MKSILAALMALLFLGVALASAEVFIIVNLDNPIDKISTSHLKAIYLMKKKAWSTGDKINTAYLSKGAAKEVFSKKIIERTSQWLKSYYITRALTGKGQPPKNIKSEPDMITYIASDVNAIGFISTQDSSVKTIFTIP